MNPYDPYDNSALVVPDYSEEELNRLGNIALFPCNTEYLKYDKNRHMYFLTTDALDDRGIEYDDQTSEQFIRKVSDHIYSYIKGAAGGRNYSRMMYRIAKSWGRPELGYVAARKEFEGILLTQAEFISVFGDAKLMPKVTISADSGRVKAADLSRSDGYWLYDGCIGALDALNLTDSKRIVGGYQVEWSEY